MGKFKKILNDAFVGMGVSFLLLAFAYTGGIFHPFGWRDVAEFGAVGDSVTDNTAAFRACAAECGRTHSKMMVGPGDFIIMDSVIILNQVTVEGSGGNNGTNDELGQHQGQAGWASTNIIQRGNNKSGFVVNPQDTNSIAYSGMGIRFLHFNLKYQNASAPTNNAGIRIVDGGSYIMDGVNINGFWIDHDVRASSYASIAHCVFQNFAYAGTVMTNTVAQDFGGSMFVNDVWTTGQYLNPYAGFYWAGSGAMRMSNSEFNFSDQVANHTMQYCMVFANTVITQELYVNDVSFSTYDSSAVLIRAANATSLWHFENIVIYGPTGDSIFKPAIDVGPANLNGTQNVTAMVFDNISIQGYTPKSASYPNPAVISLHSVYNSIIGKVQISNTSFYNLPYVFDAYCQNNQIAYTTITNNGETNANGSPTIYRFTSPYGPAYIGSDYAQTSGGADGISFYTGGYGVTAFAGYWDNQHRLFVNTNGLSNVPNGAFQVGYTGIQMRKDTAYFSGLSLVNANTGTTSGAAIALSNNTAYAGLLFEASSGWTGTLNVSANDLAMFNYNNVDMISYAGYALFGNTVGAAIFNQQNRMLIDQGTTDHATAIMQITGSGNAEEAWHYDANHFGTATVSSSGVLTFGGTGMIGIGVNLGAIPTGSTTDSVLTISSSTGQIRATQFTSLQSGSYSASTPSLLKNSYIAIQPVEDSTTSANPSGTTSTSSYKMMGLAGTITPVVTGRMLIIISGSVTNSSNADGAMVQIRYGTGAAPINGAAATGNVAGSVEELINPSSATVTVPFSCTAIITGGILNNAYWLDLGVAALTGGTATVSSVTIYAVEL
jgi:hypothetical protein